MNFFKKILCRNKQVYLDHAAATPIDSEVLSVVSKTTEDVFANPGSLHSGGEEAKQLLARAREKVANILHAGTDEVFFARGGTEACNTMMYGFLSLLPTGSLVVVNPLEHPAVLEPLLAAAAEKKIVLLELELTEDGIVTSESVKKMLLEYPQTRLVVCQYANSETGTINQIAEIGKVILSHNKKTSDTLYFVCDAIQAVNYCNLNVLQLHVHGLCISGSKIYGPRSASCLFIKRGISIRPLVIGGGQERGLRAGTEDVALVCGLALALEKAEEKKDDEKKRLREIQEFAFSYLEHKIPHVIINGGIEEGQRLPNNINVSVPDCDSEFLVLALDKKGYSVSSQSACSARSGTRSRVIRKLWDIKNIDSSQDEKGSTWADVRITMGRTTERSNIKNCIDEILQISENWRGWNCL